MSKKNWKAALLAARLPMAGLALILAACATTVGMDVQRTPAMDTTDIQRVAVMPFTAATGPSGLASALHTHTLTRLQATNAFTLVDPSVVNAARQRGAGIDSYIDAMLNGQITGFSENTTAIPREFRDRQGNVRRWTDHQRDVSVSFSYNFVRARDGSVIGPVQRSGSLSATADSVGGLPSSMDLAQRIIQNELRLFYRDVVPHTVRVNRRMEREPNRDIRRQMDVANSLMRGGNYIAARETYVAIWEQTGSIAAAINASILYEAAGETASAANLMSQVSARTGNPRATGVLSRLNQELAQQAGFAAFTDTRTPVERVSSHAIGEVGRVLPHAARVWIHNDATANQGLANDVIDNMLSAFISRGIPVVERQMIELILAEQNLHMGGSVSDADFVSIGNLAGANTIAIVSITGTGAARRLQVRVLDIETGTVTMQSGTGSEWSL